MKPAGYMGQPVVSGVAEPSGSRGPQNEDVVSLLEDIHRRCERLLTGVSERRWKDIYDQCTEPCIGLPSEWQGVMWCMAMVGEGMCDLRAARAEPLAWDPPYSD